MKILLKRNGFTDHSTEGRLYIDGEFECYTIEDADRHLETGGVKVQNQTAIPRGLFEVMWTKSVRFGKFMPEVLNVPGFRGIRIHAGNSSKDTEGCIIVGSVNDKLDDDFIGGSRIAVSRLYPKIEAAFKRGEKITLEVA